MKATPLETPFNKNNVPAIKTIKILTKILLLSY